MTKENAVAEARHGNKVLRVYRDDDPAMNPREWDNLGTMICFVDRYQIGDDHKYHNMRALFEDLAREYTDRDIEEMEDKALQAIVDKHYLILPVYAYIHGGITIRSAQFHDIFDSDLAGVVYVSKEQIRKEYNVKHVTLKLREKVFDYLRAEINVYDQYLTGDVYGFVLSEEKTCDLGHVHDEHIESCWGFYGSNWKENGLAEAVIDLAGEEYKDLVDQL